MADVTVSIPVVAITAVPNGPTINPVDQTVVLATIVRKATVRRGPRVR